MGEHSEPTSANAQPEPANQNAFNPDVRIAELSKAGLGKRWEALSEKGEVFVPGNGQISFLGIVRRSYLMRCDTLKQKTAVAEAIKGIKLKELAEYHADDAGNLYVRLSPTQLERLNAAIDMPSEHVGVQEISRARNVLDIRSRVSAAANKTTRPVSTTKELDIDADILMAELNLMAA